MMEHIQEQWRKLATPDEFSLKALVDEIIEANDEYGFSDYAIENINDRMRDAGIGKAERAQLIEAAHIEATRRMAERT